MAKYEEENAQEQHAGKEATDDQQQVSAADYDPNVDRKLEEERRVWAAKKQENTMDVDTTTQLVDDKQEQAGDVEEEAEEEMEDDLEDMFAVDAAPKKKAKRAVKVSSLASFSY